MRASPPGLALLALILLGASAGCSPQETLVRRKISLGTNGSIVVTSDSHQRVRELRQFKADRSLKLKVKITYAQRDIERLLVFDPHGQEVWHSVFASNSETSGGHKVDSLGWEVREEGEWSGQRGEIHDSKSWFCGDELLYRVHRTWPDDRSRVHYEVSGPSGVLLFTNTYAEK